MCIQMGLPNAKKSLSVCVCVFSIKHACAFIIAKDFFVCRCVFEQACLCILDCEKIAGKS